MKESSSYEQERKRLQEIERKLQGLAGAAEAVYESFRRMTKECVQRIAKCHQLCQQRHADNSIDAFQYGLKHYLKQWFRTFLGVKDECMLLITGELIRAYHTSLHETHTHDREKEINVYNQQCTLSKCSVDGVDYEYRQLVEKFGNRSGLDKIADENELVSQKVNALSKDIDDEFMSIKKAVTSCSGGGGSWMVSFDLRHCAEYLEIKYQPPSSSTFFLTNKEQPAVVTQPSSFKLSGTALRKCSKVQALCTVLEDLEELVDPVVVKTSAKPSTISNKTTIQIDDTTEVQVNVKKSRKRNLDLEDSDDEAEAQKPTKSPMDNFVVSVSLDEIKRTYGASESLLVEQPLQEEPVNKDDKVVIDISTEQDPNNDTTALSNMSQRRGIFPVQVVQVKCRVMDPYNSSDNSSSYLSGKSGGGNSFVVIPVEVRTISCPSLIDPKLSINVILVNELFQVLIEHLWTTSTNKVDHRLWLPRQIQVDGVVYSKGGDIPVTATLGSKIYPVLCDNQESTLIFLQHLHQRMVAESLEFQSTLRKLFISYLEDIRIVLQVLKKGKELNCNRIWNYSLSARTGVLIAKHELDIDDDMKTFAIHEVAMTGMYKQVKARLISEASVVQSLCRYFSVVDLAYSQINISHSATYSDSKETNDVQEFAMQSLILRNSILFNHWQQVGVQSNGFSMKAWLQNTDPVKSWLKPMLSSISEVDYIKQLSSTGASIDWQEVLSYLESNLMDKEPIFKFFTSLLRQCPSLESLDITSCGRESVFHQAVLCTAVLVATKQRADVRILHPLRKVVAKGMATSFPQLTQAFTTRLQNFVEDIDTSGHSFPFTMNLFSFSTGS